ncbi:hypothetical protein DVH24_007000 [Malus domestica]|uniref:Pantothenate kinase n=1 Tax=Malus domestica TaxID=3750 RepID=A0A498HHF1_MALDO|nr:hypothetical protein DVH24_007000 [Malus domestica]
MVFRLFLYLFCLLAGSLIKLVYFSTNSDDSSSSNDSLAASNGDRGRPVLEGKLHFAKFETQKINDCIDFIRSKQLRLTGSEQHGASGSAKCVIKATGGGAFKYADLFKEKLGISLDKADEMDCLVAGANFLLKAVHPEAFTYMGGQKEFVKIDHDDLYPYLLVNIGSGVSMIKPKLQLCLSFDELLELSHRGNNRVIDMLVGDIYGGMDYTKIGLVSTAIASSFGKAISDNKELEDYKPEDISRSLLRMISNNVGQISYLNALRFGLKRIFFAGFFIRGHAYTMDTIAVAVHFWSKGEAKAMFLKHEGFLGALGSFMSYEKHGFEDLKVHQSVQQYPVGASLGGDTSHDPPNEDLNENQSIDCSVYLS